MSYASEYAKKRTVFFAAAQQLANAHHEPYYVFTHNGQLKIESKSFFESKIGKLRYPKGPTGEVMHPEVEYTKPRSR